MSRGWGFWTLPPPFVGASLETPCQISDLIGGKTRWHLLTWHEAGISQLHPETLCFWKGPTQNRRHPVPCTKSQQHGVTQGAKGSGRSIHGAKGRRGWGLYPCSSSCLRPQTGPDFNRSLSSEHMESPKPGDFSLSLASRHRSLFLIFPCVFPPGYFIPQQPHFVHMQLLLLRVTALAGEEELDHS